MTRITKLLWVAALGSVALLSGCDSGGLFGCDNTVRGEQVSPAGTFKAAILDVQCGATTADASWVLLTDSKTAFKYKEDRLAVFEGHVDRVVWNEGDLVVFYGDSKPFHMEQSARGVHISYQGKR